MNAVRVMTMRELVDDTRPPTSDDVPMTRDWVPLDTREKLIAYLEEINRERSTRDDG